MSVFSRLMRPSGKAPRNTADAMNDSAWITESLKDSRARALAALLRYFRDLDTAEDALQEACVQAIRVWSADGPPRDPVAWLVLVGRNAGIDELRRRARNEPLPAEDMMSDTDDADPALIDRLERSRYRDDVLRLLFVCCHSALPLPQQLALALRVVSGLSLAELASAFLVSEDAMEQRITRAKRRIGELRVPFEAPGRIETGRRLSAVLSTLYLVFNEGYAASGGEQHLRPALCEEAIRLVRLLHQLFDDDAEVGGLVALMLLQHARAAARLDAAGDIVLLEAQDRTRWDPAQIELGLAYLHDALARQAPGPYQLQAAIAATHARAPCAELTDWGEIDRLYAALEALQPSPVVTLNRAVAVSKLRGPAAALRLVDPLTQSLAGYFHFHGLRGALLHELDRPEEARAALDCALAMARTPAERRHIHARLDALRGREPDRN